MAATQEKTYLVARFDVTGLSEAERDALAGEVIVQGESSDDHPGVEVATTFAADPPTSHRRRKVRIGEVGVDSGQVMITDPSYIGGVNGWDAGSHPTREEYDEAEAEGADLFAYSYKGACLATSSRPNLAGQLRYALGHPGAGVVASSGYGDGVYPVYADYNDEGRLVALHVLFDEGGEGWPL